MSNIQSRSILEKTHYVGYISPKTGKIVVCTSGVSERAANHIAKAYNKAYKTHKHQIFDYDSKISGSAKQHKQQRTGG